MDAKKGLSKASRIRALLDKGQDVATVAAAIGVLPEYVRAVRQRGETGESAADKARWIRRYGSIQAANKTRNAATRTARVAYYRKRRLDPSYLKAQRLWQRVYRAKQKLRHAEARV